jgi:uncharacterized protein (TIGR00288 family)
MSTDNRVAIFIDAENLTQWIKQGGLDVFLEELTSLGPVVVRKAYARWTSSNVTAHQSTLNRLGFELIHSFHPVSGKNSADIQITVDVMEYATREELKCIALATGDSDFSPLFRRLREMGKQVVGAGPRSALSESVKSSCSRFVYTETAHADAGEKQAALASAFDDAADLLESVLKTFDGPANCATLKNRMLNIDSAFDEKNLGFKSFTDFVKAVPGVGLTQDHNTWHVSFQDTKPQPTHGADAASAPVPEVPPLDATEQYKRLLRRKHWRSIPSSLLVRCFAKLQSIGPLPRSEMPETAVVLCDGGVTTADMRKAADLLFKAGFVEHQGKNENGESLWRVTGDSDDKMIRAVDRAMLVRLLVGLDETSSSLDTSHLQPLLLGQYRAADLDGLITEAKKARRSIKTEESAGSETGSNNGAAPIR